MTWAKWIPLLVLTFLLTGCGGNGERQDGDDSSDVAVETPTGGLAEEPPTLVPENEPPGTVADGLAATDGTPPRPALPDTGSPSPPQGDGVRSVVLQLTSEDLRVRGRAVDLLDQTDDAVPRCIEFLKDENTEVRRGAAFFLLGKFDAGNPQVDEALIAALTDENPGVRLIALQAVNELKNDAVLPALGQLARMLENPQEAKHLRTQIARRLGRLGPQAGETLPTLSKLGRDDLDRDIRAACLYAVYKVATADQAVDVFRKVLRSDTDAGLRGVAASRLGGYSAAAAVPDLAAALDAERDSEVREKIAGALARIGEPALAALVERFNADDPEVRLKAIFAVGRMGSAAAQAIPQLERLRNADDRDVRLAAELSIRRIQGAP